MTDENTATPPTSVGELSTGMELRGTIKRVELYGAFVDVGVGQDGLLHISQLGKANVKNVEDVVKVGQNVMVYVLRVEPENGRIALSLVKPPAVSWDDLKVGQEVNGKVVRLENFGVFVDIGAERPGMIHVSELASGYVNSPSEVVKVGDEVKARIISVNRKKRRLDLSLKAMEEPVQIPDEPDDEHIPTAMELALRQAMEGTSAKERTYNRAEEKRSKQEKRARELDDLVSRTLKHHTR